MRVRNLEFPMTKLEALCRCYHVRELSLFGSALRGGTGAHGDVDLLVEFEADAQVGFMTLSRMQRELSQVLGCPVDLVPKNGLKAGIRQSILSAAEVLYAS